jgi:hypothetical protein
LYAARFQQLPLACDSHSGCSWVFVHSIPIFCYETRVVKAYSYSVQVRTYSYFVMFDLARGSIYDSRNTSLAYL